MKRKIKNIVMIVLILVLCGTMFLTINYAKKDTKGEMANMQGMTAPDMSENSFGKSMEEPPEKPDGDKSGESSDSNSTFESSNGDKNMGDVPEKPEGDNGMGEMQNNENNSSILIYLALGIQNLILLSLIIYLIISKFNKKTFKETLPNGDKKIIFILINIILAVSLTYADSKITKNNLSDNKQNESTSVTYSAANEITENKTLTSGEFKSTKKDENALLVSGDIDVSLSNINVNKTGNSDETDNASFYGVNSGIIVKDKANVVLKNINVVTKADGANGVFTYGGSATTNNDSSDGTTVTISDSTITTTKDNSGGIMTTGGGVTKANNLTVKTAGTSSAAIRTDRGGGTVTVNKGEYTTTGAGSPTIYSTAAVTVSNATLNAKTSEGIVIEGNNEVTIKNCKLTDSNTKLNGKSTTYKNIFLYQSMSGDAANGSSTFTASDSEIITNKGDSFYVTNTSSTINLENNTIVNNDDSGNFLRVQKDSWGNEGSNGGNVKLILTKEEALGNIVIDSISTLDMTMKTNSYYEGTINSDNSAKKINLTLDKNSKIKLTGNSYITSLDNADEENSNIDFNGYKLYVNGTAIN